MQSVQQRDERPADDRPVVMRRVEELKTGKYQVMPERTDAELKQFAENVKYNGVQKPLEIDEDDYVIDGHTRLAAAKQAELTVVPCLVIRGASEEDKVQRAYRQSTGRQLTRKQVRGLIETALLKFHDRSNAFIATLVPATDRTVAKVRNEMIRDGRIPYHEQLRGLNGQMQDAGKRPAAKKAGKRAKKAPSPLIGSGKLAVGDDGLTISGVSKDKMQSKAKKVRVFRSSASKALLAEAVEAGFACLILPEQGDNS